MGADLMICDWTYLKMGLCAYGAQKQGTLTILELFFIFVVIFYPILIGFEVGKIVGYKQAKKRFAERQEDKESES